ncbi:XRE family transcriptional regulator [Frankia sp. CcI156]|uniref:Transcriptional regulator, XRE family n=1 Tax=Frankia casuarinae (strain DSM 45818 / CECT 9043 / HFP020203 / CcI3) TaxID=106370 RepID=Q2JCG0_FRACC|nr:transcriptional regulator [Frankia sp. CcI156]ABD11032.1 transcriptional regulator, XRE family [Frankia casuarinae]ONH28502.1 XRE family transcriptional regulator [Frankia sp. CcI156]
MTRTETVTEADYALELGRRLRAARNRRGLSLLDVQERTHGRWTAGTLGAYERGSRTLRVHRLVELAELYDVPATLLVPPAADRRETDHLPPLVIDLRRLRKLPPTRTGPLRRWIAIVQVLRSDSSRDVLRLRRSDLQSLSRLYSTTPAMLYERLGAWGALVEPGEPVAVGGRRRALPVRPPQQRG